MATLSCARHRDDARRARVGDSRRRVGHGTAIALDRGGLRVESGEGRRAMGGPWRERSIDRESRPRTAPKAPAARAATVEADAVSAAVVGFVVALVTPWASRSPASPTSARSANRLAVGPAGFRASPASGAVPPARGSATRGEQARGRESRPTPGGRAPSRRPPLAWSPGARGEPAPGPGRTPRRSVTRQPIGPGLPHVALAGASSAVRAPPPEHDRQVGEPRAQALAQGAEVEGVPGAGQRADQHHGRLAVLDEGDGLAGQEIGRGDVQRRSAPDRAAA